MILVHKSKKLDVGGVMKSKLSLDVPKKKNPKGEFHIKVPLANIGVNPISAKVKRLKA